MDDEENSSKENTDTSHYKVCYTQKWVFASQPWSGRQYYTFGPFKFWYWVSWKIQKTGIFKICLHSFHNIGIKHGFSCINICQVLWEVLKTEAEARSFQHLPRDLANVNALKNHVWSLLLHKNWKHLIDIALFLLHYFVSPFHQCCANAISTDYALSRAGQYTSHDGSNFVALGRTYWKLRRRALTAH